jgi:uncharacterized membrane protein YbaN (DUF454 family)
MNQGLIVMAAWRLADQPDNFLHLVLKSKYFPDSSIWRQNSNVPKSAFWTSILRILPILKAHSFYQITMGQISVWSTPWCDKWAHIYDSLIIQPTNYTYLAKLEIYGSLDINVEMCNLLTICFRNIWRKR